MNALHDDTDRMRGFTLLEIILSLAILAGALAALGEVMRTADRNAAATGDETEAQVIAATIMDELASGARQLTAVQQAQFDATTSPPWLYSIEFYNTDLQELVGVRVRVEQGMEAQLQLARYELVRWMSNPSSDAAATDASSTSTGSGSSTSSSSSSSGGSGGQP